MLPVLSIRSIISFSALSEPTTTVNNNSKAPTEEKHLKPLLSEDHESRE